MARDVFSSLDCAICSLFFFALWVLPPAPFLSPRGSPALTVEGVVWDAAFFPVSGKEMIPDGAGDHDNDPVQRAEEQALDRVPVLMDAEPPDVAGAQENEDPQRQSSAVPGQTGDEAVAEPLAAKAPPAEEEHQQTGQIDRQSPGELQQVENDPAPARAGGRRMGVTFRLVHPPLFGHRTSASAPCRRTRTDPSLHTDILLSRRCLFPGAWRRRPAPHCGSQQHPCLLKKTDHRLTFPTA